MAAPFWLRGPIDGVTPLLQPVAHALLQASEEVRTAIAGLSPQQLQARRLGTGDPDRLPAGAGDSRWRGDP